MYNAVVAAAPCNVSNSTKKRGPDCICLVGYKGYITWDGVTASGSCTETQCTGNYTDPPKNGRVSLTDGDRHGSTATFTCNDGYEIVGTKSITCDAKEADEEWPPSSATCNGMHEFWGMRWWHIHPAEITLLCTLSSNLTVVVVIG